MNNTKQQIAKKSVKIKKQKLMQTPSIMDSEVIHIDKDRDITNRKVEDMKMGEVLDYMENYCNQKISSGLQMIVQKIIVLVDEQVKFRVVEEVVEQIQTINSNGPLFGGKPSAQVAAQLQAIR